MVGSKCNLKMHVWNLGYPFTLQIGGPKTTFLGRLRNLRATLTAYIFGTKHEIDNRSSALTTTRGFLHHSKMSWSLVHKRLQTRPPFLPTLRKFCIPLHCQASSSIRRRQKNRLAFWCFSATSTLGWIEASQATGNIRKILEKMLLMIKVVCSQRKQQLHTSVPPNY